MFRFPMVCFVVACHHTSCLLAHNPRADTVDEFVGPVVGLVDEAEGPFLFDFLTSFDVSASDIHRED
jgi:hypothetical protein